MPRTVIRGWDDEAAARAVADALRPEIGRFKCPHLVLADGLEVGDATADGWWRARRAPPLRAVLALNDLYPEFGARLMAREIDDRRARLIALLDEAIREVKS